MAKLNEEQTKAVEHPIGIPACLVAGAGSGKTSTMTERVRWLISQGVPAKRILAVTFTNKAAGELTSRLGITEDTPHDECPRVSTIHSLALSAIRRSPQGFGLQSKVTPLDDYEQTQMVKKIIERGNPNAKDVVATAMRTLEKVKFHRAKGVGFPEEYTADVNDRALVEHAGYHALNDEELSLWHQYQKEKFSTSVLDFDDMIHLCVRRGREDEKWRTALQRQFDHVLQDEAQDTSVVQWEFVNMLLAPDNMNLFCVGDISQSIMSFNGSCPQLLIDYSNGWRGVTPTLYRIARNHRSLPKIIDLANNIQQRMTATIPITMEYFRGSEEEKGHIGILRAKSNPISTADIADVIAAMIHRDSTSKSNPILFKQNCILVRSGIQVRDIEGALVKYRIPYVVRGGRGLLQTEEVRDILSYLRLATNPKDFMAFSRAVSTPKRGMGDVAIEKLRQLANEQFGGDLISAAAAMGDKLYDFVTLMREAQGDKDTPLRALDVIIAKSKYRGYVESKYKKEPDKIKQKFENLDRFKELIEGLISTTQMTTEDLVFQLTLDKGKENDKEGMVVISTIHASKGLEWKRVFVPTCYEGSLPHKFSMGSPEEIEEERRLWYVAVTRAQDSLVIGVPSREVSFEKREDGKSIQKTRMLTPSRFLHEVGIM